MQVKNIISLFIIIIINEGKLKTQVEKERLQITFEKRNL